MKTLVKFLVGWYIIICAVMVADVLILKGIHVPIANQWLALVHSITYINTIPMVGLTIFSGALCVDDEDIDLQTVRVWLYNNLTKNPISSIWVIVPALLTCAAFQYEMWRFVICYLPMTIGVLLFKISYNKIILRSKVEELS